MLVQESCPSYKVLERATGGLLSQSRTSCSAQNEVDIGQVYA